MNQDQWSIRVRLNVGTETWISDLWLERPLSVTTDGDQIACQTPQSNRLWVGRVDLVDLYVYRTVNGKTEAQLEVNGRRARAFEWTFSSTPTTETFLYNGQQWVLEYAMPQAPAARRPADQLDHIEERLRGMEMVLTMVMDQLARLTPACEHAPDGGNHPEASP